MNHVRHIYLTAAIVAVLAGVLTPATVWAGDAPTGVSATSPAQPSAVFDNTPSFAASLTRMFLTLGAILAGLFALLYLIRRRSCTGLPVGRNRLIEVLDTRRLEPRRTLYLVRIGGQIHLIGSAESGLCALARGLKDRDVCAERVQPASSTAVGDNDRAATGPASFFNRMCKARPA